MTRFEWAGLIGLGLPMVPAVGQSGPAMGERTIRGTVREAVTGMPLPFAQVQVRGAQFSTLADNVGHFTVRSPDGSAELVIRLIGYKEIVSPVHQDSSAVTVHLNRVAINLDEVVVSGQASGVTRRNAATSVTTVSGEDLTRVSQQSIEHGFQGKIPGAQISQRTGAPGGGTRVKIRGISTLLGGSVTPLYVVDGVLVADTDVANNQSRITAGAQSESPANRITDLNPNDIESIEVLKGSAAGAIYGSKASNGVILITTKRGHATPPRWQLSQGYGSSRLAYRHGHRRWSYDDAVAYFGNAAAQYFDPLTRRPLLDLDYESLAYGETPLNSDFSLSLSGGNADTRYYLAGSARDEGGIVANTGAQKLSLRANIDQVPNARSHLRFSATGMRNADDRGLFDNENGPNGIGSSVGYTIPKIPSFLDLRQNADGSWPVNPFLQSNPLQNIALARNHDEILRGVGGVELRWNLLESPNHDARFVANGGADALVQRYEVLTPPELQSEAVLNTPGRSLTNDHRTVMTNLNLNVVDVWRASSRLTVTNQVGSQYERWDQDVLSTGSSNLGGGLSVVHAGAGFAVTDFRLRVEDFGMFAQSEWLFDDGILITLGARADRSSANADTKKFFLFPKASLSWRPGFFPAQLLSDVKLRLAYGETGNRPWYSDKFTTLTQGTVGGNTSYRASTRVASPTLRPERQREFEGGLDASLFQNAGSIELTAWERNISDLLLSSTPAPSTGYATTFSNGGRMRVKGFEAAVTLFPLRTSRFEWTTRATYGMNRSKVLELQGDTLIVLGSRLSDGQVWLRAGHSATEITGIDTLPAPGAIVRVGDGAPRWTGGISNEFRIGGLSLFVLLDHQAGGRLVAGTWALYDQLSNALDHDVVLSDGSKLGDWRRSAANRVTTVRNQDATYTKLREVSLSYVLPVSMAQQLRARAARVVLSGRNLVWWTTFRGGDPEAENFFGGFELPQVQRNRELAAYPASRQFWATIYLEF